MPGTIAIYYGYPINNLKGEMKMLKKIISLTILLLLTDNVAMANFIFSNKKYQTQLDVKVFLMNNDQICPLFNNNKAEQKTYDSLLSKWEKLYCK